MTDRHEDAVLFALRDECGELLDAYLKAKAEADEVRARADADPDCPPLDADEAARYAHWRKHGWIELNDRCHLSNTRIRGMSGAFFEAPVGTVEGVHAKIQFALLLEEKVRDDDLATWPYRDDWLEQVESELADLVRVEAKAKPADNVLESGPCTAAIRNGVYDLDDPLGCARRCGTTIGQMIGHIGDETWKQTMFSINDDLMTALIRLDKVFNQLHKAVHGRVDEAERLASGGAS